MIKRVLRYLLYGIAWGSVAFVLINSVGVIVTGNKWLLPLMDNFLAQVLGCEIAGICSASAAIVYTFKKLARWKQISIHFAVGLTGYFAVAYKLKWMPVQSIGGSVLFILLTILLFIAIWLCFFLASRHDVKKMNQRLKELSKEQDNDSLSP